MGKIRSWWVVRDLPNVHLVHFADLKADLPGEIARIAAFLGISHDSETMARVVGHCSFDYMKAHGVSIELINVGEVDHTGGFPLAMGQAALWFETMR